MLNEDLIQRIYLGDRGVLGFELRSDINEFRIYVSSISLISGDIWNPDIDTEYPNAKLLFKGVRSLLISPPGSIPNDYIHSLKTGKFDAESGTEFLLECDASLENETVSATIHVVAESISIEV